MRWIVPALRQTSLEVSAPAVNLGPRFREDERSWWERGDYSALRPTTVTAIAATPASRTIGTVDSTT